MEGHEQSFNIQFVSNITGINPHTIRAWEKRYKAIEPHRDHNGRRLYTNEDINHLSLLNKLVKMGNSISDIASLSIDELNEIGQKYSTANKMNEKVNVNFDYQSSLKNIYMGLDFFKLDVINHELDKCATELRGVDFALNIIAPILAKIRSLKEENRITRDQRIQLYLILKSHLIKKIYKTNINNNNKKRVIIAGAQGDLNELGSMLVTILFLDQGYDVDFLGGNVEDEFLGKICSQFKPDLLFIGLNYSHESQAVFLSKEKYLETVNQYLTNKTRVMIGAYDVCFKLPNIDFECFTDFKEIQEAIKRNL